MPNDRVNRFRILAETCAAIAQKLHDAVQEDGQIEISTEMADFLAIANIMYRSGDLGQVSASVQRQGLSRITNRLTMLKSMIN